MKVRLNFGFILFNLKAQNVEVREGLRRYPLILILFLYPNKSLRERYKNRPYQS